jgi:hypothetical protein
MRFRVTLFSLLLFCASAFADLLPPRQATTAEVVAGSNVKAYVNPKQYKDNMSGGGSSLPTNGADGSIFVRGPGGTIVQTNYGAFLGYGILTNKNAFMLYGDSRAKSDNSGSTTIQSYLTNTYLPSNFRFITNGGIGGQTVATMMANFPAFINDYKALTASGSGTNVIIINLCGINDIVNFVGGSVVASNYDRLLWLERQSNCIPVAVTTSPAYSLGDTELGNLKIFNDLVMASTNWTYIMPAHQTIAPPPEAGEWADNIHNNSSGNDRIAFLINLALLSGPRNAFWFVGYTYTPPSQRSGSAADSSGLASSVVGLGSTPSLHLLQIAGNNAFGITPFGNNEYVEWNSASGALALGANVKYFFTPTNTTFQQPLALQTNVLTPAVPNAGYFYVSNNADLYWVTPAKTNLITLGH